MALYLDSAYIAKLYLQEPDSNQVRKLVEGDPGLHSSAWCVVEMACIFHRHVREKRLTAELARRLTGFFKSDLRDGLLALSPLSEELLRKAEIVILDLPAPVFLRAGAAIHLVSAREAGFAEIWTNDRHLLAAAPHLGLRGRTV
ncbi:MAG TPA: type II toxin-antitoxin system VapC family toxin [Bryobacterales bacterium]|nr:type II toxin-antitoxin system VapC family toxin [Bryobacterales bacterium]